MMVEKTLFLGNNIILLIFLGVLFLALTIIRIIILRPLCQPIKGQKQNKNQNEDQKNNRQKIILHPYNKHQTKPNFH